MMKDNIPQLIVLVCCVKEKSTEPCKAKLMYQGPLFRTLMGYAQSLVPDHIRILSGKYHLLELDQIISPYDVNLNQKGEEDLKIWASRVRDQLSLFSDLNTDRFVILSNEVYRRYLCPYISHFEVPFFIE